MSKFKVVKYGGEDYPSFDIIEADKVVFMGIGGIKFEAQAGGFVAAYGKGEWREVHRLEEID